MHRVDSDGYTTVSGDRRFIDRSLPTEEGTVDGAYWNNAIQEEIAQVVEHAGLTLAASGSDDQTADWGQLKEAIFESEAISNDALKDDLSLSKFSQGAIDFYSAVTDSTVTLNTALVSFGDFSTGIFAAYSRAGIRFAGNDEPGTEDVTVRFSTYDISSNLNSATETVMSTMTSDGHTHGIGINYQLATTVNTMIPATEKILGHIASGVDDSNADDRNSLSLQLHYTDVGGFWHVDWVQNVVRSAFMTPSTTDDVLLTIFYDGDYLD